MFPEKIFQTALMILIGSAAGGIIAGGVFAFLAIIGVYPRLIGATGTHKHIRLYESCIILGGILGNAADIYEFPLPVMMPSVFLGVFGMSVGVYVGSLAMSLAETLKAGPVIIRRMKLSVGLQYVILSVALGKLTGALIYFMS